MYDDPSQVRVVICCRPAPRSKADQIARSEKCHKPSFARLRPRGVEARQKLLPLRRLVLSHDPKACDHPDPAAWWIAAVSAVAVSQPFQAIPSMA